MDFLDENKVLMWQYYIWELFIDKEVCVFLLKGDRKESREGKKKARERNRRQGQIMTARTTVALSVSAQADGAGLLHTVVNLCGSCSGLVGFPNTSRLCLPSMAENRLLWPDYLDIWTAAPPAGGQSLTAQWQISLSWSSARQSLPGDRAGSMCTAPRVVLHLV